MVLELLVMSIVTLNNGCPKPKIENRTSYDWNSFDSVSLRTAVKRCGEIYRNSPCVKRFIKRGERDYSVVCGAPESEDLPLGEK